MDLMEIIKTLFGNEALTFEQFSDKLSSADNLKLGNLADGRYVDKYKFDDISKQLKEANEKYADYDDIKQKLSAAEADGEKKLNDYKLQVAIDKALAEAKSADEVSVKANLDMGNIAFGDDGKLTGLSDQLDKLKTDKPFLFKQEKAKPDPLLNLGGSTPGTRTEKSSGIKGAVEEYYSE